MTAGYNLSYNRLMVKGKDRLGIFMTVGKHLNSIFLKMEERKKPLEVAVSIGNHPAWAIGALAIGPYDEDELGIIGGLKGSPLEMVRCKTVDLMVPAGAEIILEGEMEPFVREPEGPLVSSRVTPSRSGNNPVLRVKAITHRHDPIYQDICGGPHREHLTMATIPMEANYFRVIKGAVPEVEAVRMAAPFTLVISMRKKYEGQARTALIAAFSADLYLKHAIVVDHDIDISDLQRVFWAVATRVQASRDIFIIPRARGSSLDPSAEPLGVTDKMGIDATAKAFSGEVFAGSTPFPRKSWTGSNWKITSGISLHPFAPKDDCHKARSQFGGRRRKDGAPQSSVPLVNPYLPIFSPRLQYSMAPGQKARKPALPISMRPLSSWTSASIWAATTSPKKRSWLPKGMNCFTRHSRFTGHSRINGAFTFSAAKGVSRVAANLSTLLPEATPQKSISFRMAVVGRLATNSPVLLMIPCECRSGRMATEIIGGSELATPTHAKVMMFGFGPLVSAADQNDGSHQKGACRFQAFLGHFPLPDILYQGESILPVRIRSPAEGHHIPPIHSPFSKIDSNHIKDCSSLQDS